MHQYTLLKIVIIGDSGCGKTTMAYKFVHEKTPPSDYGSTIGIEFLCKRFKVKEMDLKMHIWDTAGQESFKSITRSYYRGAAGALLVYDITRKETFNHLTRWLEEVR